MYVNKHGTYLPFLPFRFEFLFDQSQTSVEPFPEREIVSTTLQNVFLFHNAITSDVGVGICCNQ